MQIQNDFFAPADQMVAELIPNVKSPVKSIEFTGNFPEHFRFYYQFAFKDLCPRSIFDHMQDEDSIAQTIDEQKRSEMFKACTKDLDRMTTNPDKVDRCYRFFEQVAKELLHAKSMGYFKVVVKESDGTTHCRYYKRR